MVIVLKVNIKIMKPVISMFIVVMVFSQAFQALILPAVAIPIFILINRKPLMKDHVAGIGMNISLGIIVLYSLLTSYFAIADFF